MNHVNHCRSCQIIDPNIEILFLVKIFTSVNLSQEIRFHKHCCLQKLTGSTEYENILSLP